MKISLQSKGEGGGTDRAQISQESFFEAKILDVKHRETRWDASKKDDDGNWVKLLDENGNTYKNKEFNFRFEIQDPDGPHKDRWVWGSTSDWFSNSSKSKLANWIKAILDEPVLPEGFTIDLDPTNEDGERGEGDLDGMHCRVVVQAKKRDDGTYSNWVSDVFPTKAGQTVQDRVQEHLAGNDAPAEPAYDPNEEPF